MTTDPRDQQAETFRRVFADTHFPLLSADLVALAAFLSHPDAAEGCHLVLDFPSVRPDRLDAVLAAFTGLITRIVVPPALIAFFRSAPAVRNTPAALARVEALLAPGADRAVLSAVGPSALRWEAMSPWPAVYRQFIGQLHTLVEGHARLLADRRDASAAMLQAKGFDGSSIQQADMATRVLPTRFHYAAASLGAWAGGAQNMLFFSQYATSPQITDPARNQDYAARVGYDAADAKALTESGLVVVPASLLAPLLEAQGDLPVLGALPIDEVNAVHLPAHGVRETGLGSPDALPGVIVDTNYRTPFWARRLGGQALLGEREILRDHYSAFYASTPHAGLIRCKHYCAPIIDVGSVAELRALAAEIPQRSEDGIVYRGQGSLYEVPRHPKVQRLLFGDSPRPEPSLVTSAARKRFDYDSLHFALRSFIATELFGVRGAAAAADPDYRRWCEAAGSMSCEIDYAVMALAQHYGLPSHGLDVTREIDIALWFATNRFSAGPPATYTPMTEGDWGDDPQRWPVIFACQPITWSTRHSLQRCVELEAFGLGALRPERQKARFFLGGHGDHQNRLAEAVVCAFRLKPGAWPTTATFDALFPPPDEDPAYALMLRFAECRAFHPLGADQVARYHDTAPCRD